MDRLSISDSLPTRVTPLEHRTGCPFQPGRPSCPSRNFNCIVDSHACLMYLRAMQRCARPVMRCPTHIKRRERIVRTFGVILQLMLYSAAVPAQEQQKGPATDTSRVQPAVLVEVPLGKPILHLPLSFGPELQFKRFLLTDIHYGVPPAFLGGAYEFKTDLISPYLLQRQRDNELSTLYRVLGVVELGGAAYIAYLHIKKYGLF